MEIVTKEGFAVVGMKVACHWQELGKLMPLAFKEMHQRLDEVKNKVNANVLDVCLQVVNEEFTQLVCVETTDIEPTPEGMEGHFIPTQQYVYSKHTGPDYEMPNTFGKMMEWAKENGHTIDPLDFKIQYPASEDGSYDLYVKIV